LAKPAPLPTADGVAVGKGDGVDGVNHGLPLPTAILCQLPGSRQSQAVGKSCFADCRKFQLAKGPLCRVSKKNSWQRKLQSAKSQFPVVEVVAVKDVHELLLMLPFFLFLSFSNLFSDHSPLLFLGFLFVLD